MIYYKWLWNTVIADSKSFVVHLEFVFALPHLEQVSLGPQQERPLLLLLFSAFLSLVFLPGLPTTRFNYCGFLATTKPEKISSSF